MSDVALRLTNTGARMPTWLVVAVTSAVGLALGWAFMSMRMLALVPIAVLIAIPLATSVRVRTYFLVFGALAVFQSSGGLTMPKLAFLFGMAVSFGVALVRMSETSRTPAYPALVPLLRASVVMFALIAVSLPVSIAYDVPNKAWLRDVAPYILFAAAPLFALDAQAGMRSRELRRLLVIAGTLSAISFTARWLTNHGIAALPLDQLGLPTLLLAGAVFSYGIAIMLHERRVSLRWLLLTSLVLAGVVSTGTRGALAILAAPGAIVLGSRRRIGRRSVRLAIAIPIAAVLAYAGVQAALRATDANRTAFQDRVTLLFSAADRTRDHSYVDRLAQTRSSWRLFRSSPLVGVGPGHDIPWTDSFGEPQPPRPNVDSSVSFLTKFGALGLGTIVLLAMSFVSSVRRFTSATREITVVQLALWGYGAVVAAWSVLVIPFEDKGVAIGLLLLLAAAGAELREVEAARSARGTSD
jgi:O-antigen ligase